MGSRRLLAVLLILGLAGTAYAGQEVQITACGQFVPNRATGVLVTDLDCDAEPGPRRCYIDPAIECSDFTDCPSNGCLGDYGVFLLSGSTLELNGYAIRGGDISVVCLRGKCTVQREAGEVAELDCPLELHERWLRGTRRRADREAPTFAEHRVRKERSVQFRVPGVPQQR